ncbi:Signal recognition particle receptor FtsY [uncultured archaeon]|nr:Signal recognition particle receptor FtsY [uncultured archaeon]
MFEGLKKKFSEFASSFGKKEKERVEEEIKEEQKELVKTGLDYANKEEGTPIKTVIHGKVPDVPAHMHKPEKIQHRPEVEKVKHAVAKEQEPEKKLVQEKTQIIHAELSEKPKKKPDVTFVTKIKGAVLGEVKISEKDIDPFLEQLRIALLQTDVNFDVAERIVERMRANMLKERISARDISEGIRNEIRSSIMEIMSKNPGIDVVALAEEKKARKETPFKIVFLGPNGAGKTTTVAKMANMLGARGLRCAISASDTFRAAAIEQSVYHAKKLGIEVVKGNYGSDPASIAFDAVAYAKAHGIDVVLIDTAGRQETNKSLIEELRKIVRVNKPDVCIFVGEGIAGNSLLDQVMQFNDATKVDGIILTKLDCDAKGGNTLSILSDTKIPVLYFGIGEKYNDLIPYDPKFVVDSIVPE